MNSNTFTTWIEEFGRNKLAKRLKVHPYTVELWEKRYSYPRTGLMRRIKRLTKGEITYDMMIDPPLKTPKRRF